MARCLPLAILFLCLPAFAMTASAQTASPNGQGHDHQHDLKVSFPDVPGFLTLVTDFHMHTVFSDGSVWPDIRVQEAKREGVDVIAFTEHLEYQPHRSDIPHPDRNRAYELGKTMADSSVLMVVNGSEITRSMPPGHSNAVFIQDANRLLQEDPMAVFKEANDQGAFVFWNHPHWMAQRPDGVARLDSMHHELIGNGWLHGIEVVNERSFSPEALQIALDHDLTIMGTSDIHGLTDWEYGIAHGGHRAVTLVFTPERTPQAVRQSLFDRRTVVWYEDQFIGREEVLRPFLEACVGVEAIGYRDRTQLLEIELRNDTHSHFILRNTSGYALYEGTNVFVIEPKSTLRVHFKTLERLDRVDLTFEVLSAFTAPDVHPSISVTLPVVGD